VSLFVFCGLIFGLVFFAEVLWMACLCCCSVFVLFIVLALGFVFMFWRFFSFWLFERVVFFFGSGGCLGVLW